MLLDLLSKTSLTARLRGGNDGQICRSPLHEAGGGTSALHDNGLGPYHRKAMAACNAAGQIRRTAENQPKHPGRKVAPSMRQKTVERHYTGIPRASDGAGEGTRRPPVMEAEAVAAMTCPGARPLKTTSSAMS